ncbi:MAG TPA: glycoside hydrolase family 3 C-terminal domain-containing protein [Gordonia sp. (in: high G+C Gram-positive bacteria)]|uniref:glycoside hydrolase family 3 C-terminal domain-containing protein n=1 Tax=unclassified Gordonia (in: high G+C Gram-positive bacteria) TaxID=2657482 RepID=UPI000FAB6E0D|nr:MULTISPECIES: glycoside hydrolase family 3 C-terminal domain-containing protein [unclassified Gordonia (in: high G+C Gram-positive bacteria)]RUP36781.1 MAG: beta-glucosidase [Gordonia sp. (in: high G+C Gram-positive bacteria)]HNP56975.1 glycoside hydrolase family 3 C-terminal domain-containing protein [Gordonia sp. (in: high G+C Gram-positive bacteria)]HRC50419.1 glycoside hydrolase family 3 C-terminal domain-containing protein [Gordonia sp. (in: high G+C Gram-positive bacteria)]
MPSKPSDHLSRACDIVASLTLEQKAAVTTGASFWETVGVDGAPAFTLTDGPHGIRKQTGDGDALGLNDSVVAVCFPPAVAMAATFDTDLSAQVGDALGRACLAEKIGVLLGPGINMKRSPLGGRNFEYYSEDPFLAGRMAAAYVNGVQAHGVGTSLKHFAANNQETERFRYSADIDPRPLHETYLRAFEHVVRAAQPWSVMAAYNKINGVYATQDRWLLTDTLRGRWGFEGLVVSDWGAVDDRVASVAAGLDLEMPGGTGLGPAAVVAAVGHGALDEGALDEVAQRVIALALTAADNAVDTDYDKQAQHDLAVAIARRCIVLLRNEPVGDAPVLPLAPAQQVAVIGEFARTPRYQGGGSSKVNPTQVDAALEQISVLAETDVVFEPGFTTDGDGDDAGLAAAAVAAARDADVAVLFLGVPDGAESEGFDRTGWELPRAQLDLLAAVLEVNPRTAVVLSHGAVLDLAEVVAAPAVVDGQLLGEGGGAAVADILYGLDDPSGRLAETVPLRLQDTPAYLDFPGELLHVRYGEGVFIGHRYYDARGLEVRFPFGHGLSYTTTEFTDVSAVVTDDGIDVTLTATNTGGRDGRAVVQVYTGLDTSVVARPPRELKGMAAVRLAAGESTSVAVHVPRAELAYWDRDAAGPAGQSGDWVVEGGEYRIDIGHSSRDIVATTTATVAADPSTKTAGLASTLSELLADKATRPIVLGALEKSMGITELDPTLEKLIGSIPLGRIAPMLGLNAPELEGVLAKA